MDDIKNVTIENVLLNEAYNDLGFLVRDQMIVLVEAQSTWSENIIIRLLMYYNETLKRYLDEKDVSLYRMTTIEIPRPEFYVLYAEPNPEKITKTVISLREDILHGAETDLDMRVHVLANDNSDSIIGQYMTFTKILYGQVALHGRSKKTIEETISICMDENILKDYLSGREKEVVSMISFVFDQQRQMELYVKDEREHALRVGEAKNLVKNVEHAVSKLGSLDEACDIVGCTEEEYRNAKKLLEKEAAVV